AGPLAGDRINIISAQIHTRGDGIAIDTLQVNDPNGETVTSPSRWGRTLGDLRAVVAGEQSVDALLARRDKTGAPGADRGHPVAAGTSRENRPPGARTGGDADAAGQGRAR